MRTIHNPRSWSHTEMSLLKRLVYSFKFQMKVHQVTFIKRKWFVKVINPDVESAGLEACEDQKFLFLLFYFPIEQKFAYLLDAYFLETRVEI